MKKDLNCTFIIPVKIDSPDRERNCKVVVNYLQHNFDCSISILEAGTQKVSDIINIDKIRYEHVSLNDGVPFHKTKYLNEMAKNVDTPVVCCYDIDVLLPITSYTNSTDLILKGEYDVIYPYGEGMYQKKVTMGKYENIFNINDLNNFNVKIGLSIYGHCNFASMDAYRSIGLENEKFISYGPEDQEKMYRYQRLGFKMGRIVDYVYHLEHTRGKDSSENNPHYIYNMNMFEKIKNLNDEDFMNYVNFCRNQ